MAHAMKRLEKPVLPSSHNVSSDDDDISSDTWPAHQPLLEQEAIDDSSGGFERSLGSRNLRILKFWHKPRREGDTDEAPSPTSSAFRDPRRRHPRTNCLRIVTGALVALGTFQLIVFLINIVLLAVPNRLHDIIGHWGKPGNLLSHWPTDFSRDILPKPCHSHNDYWRSVPLYSGIEAGCIGTEADIWLKDDELYVGHSLGSLTPNRTLNSLYIFPLLEILDRQNRAPTVIPAQDPFLNGVFDTTPEQTMYLLIDFKTSGSELFPHVVKALEPLRSKGYLAHQNGTQHVAGPITVIGTGNTPFASIISEWENPYHDIFFDAPLAQMYETPVKGETISVQDSESSAFSYDSSNSLYASTSFQTAIGSLRGGEFSEQQLDMIRGQVQGARRRGLKSRYWETPYWPISLRNYVWTVLVREGVDILNVDDLKGATQGDWSKGRGWVSWDK